MTSFDIFHTIIRPKHSQSPPKNHLSKFPFLKILLFNNFVDTQLLVNRIILAMIAE